MAAKLKLKGPALLFTLLALVIVAGCARDRAVPRIPTRSDIPGTVVVEATANGGQVTVYELTPSVGTLKSFSKGNLPRTQAAVQVQDCGQPQSIASPDQRLLALCTVDNSGRHLLILDRDTKQPVWQEKFTDPSVTGFAWNKKEPILAVFVTRIVIEKSILGMLTGHPSTHEDLSIRFVSLKPGLDVSYPVATGVTYSSWELADWRDTPEPR